MVLTDGGEVYAWGNNEHGQLGIGNTSHQSSPVLVQALSGKNINNISPGRVSFAVTKDGQLYAWGSNGAGALGIGRTSETIAGRQLSPVLVEGEFSDKKVSQIKSMNNSVIALTDNGELYGWGSNTERQIGIGYRNSSNSPVLIQGALEGKKVKDFILSSYQFGYAVTEDGQLYSWGNNNQGQLGIGNKTTQSYPVLVQDQLAGKKVTVTRVGSYSAGLVLTEDGRVYFLGQGNTSPVLIGGDLTGKRVIDIGRQSTSSFALTDTGQMYSWGDNYSGVLGIGNTTSQSSPVLVEGNLAGKKIVEYLSHSSGNSSVFVTTEDRGLYAWGANSEGQLGIGNTTNQLAPILVSSEVCLASAVPTDVVAATNGVSGRGIPGSTITVETQTELDVTCSAVVSEDGTWFCSQFKDTDGNLVKLVPGELLTVFQTEVGKPISDPVEVRVAKQSSQPGGVVIEGGSVAGTGTPGAEVTVTGPDGTELCKTVVGGNGSWSCKFDENLIPGTGGNIEIVQQVPGESPSNPVIIVVPGTANGGKSAFVSDGKGDVVANGTATHEVTVKAVDASGRAIKNAQVVFTLPTNLSATGPVSLKTDANGLASVSVKTTVAGSYNVTAKVQGPRESVAVDVPGSANVVFVAGAYNAQSSRFFVSGGTQVAGVGQHQMTVRLMDAYGNRVTSGVNVSQIKGVVNSGASVEIGNFSSTGSAGEFVAPVSSKVAGSKSLSATYMGQSITAQGNTTANFVAGNPTQITVISEPKSGVGIADGKASVHVSATVKDAFGNPVSGTNVDFAAPTGLQISTKKTVTDSNGIASASYTSTRADSYTVKATVVGTSLSGEVSLTFEPGDYAAGNSTFTVSSGSVVANGKDGHSVNILVKDAQGNPTTIADVSKLVVSVKKTDGTVANGVVVGNPVWDSQSGSYVVSLKTTTAGSYPVSVTLAGEPVLSVGSNIAVFVPGSPNLTADGLTVLSGDVDAATANGNTSRSAKVVVKDEFGNPVKNAAVVFSIDPEITPVTLPGVFTDANGVATVSYQTTTAGTYQVTATVGGKSVVNGSPVTLTFVADSFNSGSSSYTVSSDKDVVANGVDKQSVTVILNDSYGNPVDIGAEELANVLSASAANAGVTVGDFVAGANPGEYVAPITSTVAGSFPIEVSFYQGLTAKGNASAVFVAGSPSGGDGQNASSIAADSAIGVANGSDSLASTVIIRDEFGNPVPGIEVTFAPSEGLTLAKDSALKVTTDLQVRAVSSFTATEKGKYEVNASFVAGGNTIKVVKGAPAVLTFTSGQFNADASVYTVSSRSNQSVVTGSQSVTVKLRDGQGNLLDASDGTLSAVISSAGGNSDGVSVGEFSATGTAGVFEAGVTSTVAGVFQVAVYYQPKNGEKVLLPFTDNNEATFVAGPPSVGADGSSTIVVDRSTAIANDQDLVTVLVTVLDGEKNPVVGQEVSFLPSAGLKVSDQLLTTDADGQAWVSYKTGTAGDYQVSAKIGEAFVGSESGVSFQFIAGSSVADQSTYSVSEGPLEADGDASYTVFVSVKDSQGNLAMVADVNDIALTFTKASGSPEGLVSSVPTLNESTGLYEINVSSTVAQTVQALVSLDGQKLVATSSVNMVFVPGAPDLSADGLTALSGDSGQAIANGQTPLSAQVVVRDGQGNPIEGAEVVFKASDDLTVRGQSTVTTNGSGIARVSYVSTTAGSFDITATVGGSEVKNGSPAVLIFVADQFDNTYSKFSVSQTENVVANGQDTQTVSVTLLDANSNPITVSDEELEAIVASANPAAGVSFTGFEPGEEAGVYVAQVSSTKSGSKQISVSYDGMGISPVFGSDMAVFVSGAPVSGNGEHASFLTGQGGTATADGVQARYVEARVNDAEGNPVAGVEVTFSAAGGLSAADGLTATTNAQGIAQRAFTATKAGSYEVTASYKYQDASSNITKGSPATISFKAGSPVIDPEAGENAPQIHADKDQGTANGKDAISVVMGLHDGNGNPAVGTQVRFTGIEGTSLVTEDSLTGVLDAEGQYSISVRTTRAASYPVSGQYYDQNTSKWVNIEVSTDLLFVAGGPETGANGTSNMVASNESVLADGQATQLVTVNILDAYGNGVAGQVVTVQPSPELTLVSESDYTTDANGQLNLEYTSTVAGEFEVAAKLGSNGIKNSPVTLKYHAGEFSVDGSSYSVSDGEKIADGVQTQEVSILVADGAGNPRLDAVAGDVVLSASPDSGLKISGVEGAAGRFTARVSSTMAGEFEISASYKEQVLNGSGNTVARFKAGSPSVGSDGATRIEGQSGSAVANGIAGRLVKVSVIDGNGNPVVGSKVSFQAPSELVISQENPVVTDENGVASVVYTSLTAGVFDVTAAVDGTALGKSASIEFVADQVTSDRSTYYVSDGEELVGSGAHMVTVEARDGQGNLTDSVDVTKLGASATPDNATFSGFVKIETGIYQATMTSNVAGSKVVAVSLDETVLAASGNSSALFVAGSPVIDGGNGGNGGNGGGSGVDPQSLTRMWGQTDPAVADGTSTRTVSVVVTDQFGNPVKNQVVEFIPQTGLVGYSQSATTDDSGLAQVSFVTTKVGAYQVEAKIGGKKVVTGSPVTLTFNAGKPSVSNSSAVLSSNSRVANGKDAHTITVTLRDKNQNLVDTNNVDLEELAALVSPNTGVEVSGFEPTEATGIYQAQVTSTVSGVKDVSVSYEGLGISVLGSDQLVYVAAVADLSAAVLETEAGSAVADGSETMFASVTLKDKFGNPVVGQKVSFTALGGNGKVYVKDGASVTTDQKGIAKVEFVSVLAGTFQVQAQIDGTTIGNKENTITFTAGKLDATFSTYKVSEGNVTANGVAAAEVMVTMTDANGNVVTNAKPSNLVATADPSEGVEITGFEATNTAGTYVAMVTSTVAGDKEISVSYQDKLVSSAGNTIASFTAGKIDASKSTISGQTGPAVADGNTTRWVQVNVVDANNNPVTNAPVVFTGANELLADKTNPVLTDGQGNATVTYRSYKAGQYPISATIGGIGVENGSSVDLTFVGAQAVSKMSIYTVSNGEQTAGSGTQTLTVTARDLNGNPTEINVEELSARVTHGIDATIGQFSATEQTGVYTAPVTSIHAGTASIEAFLAGQPMVAVGNTDAVFIAASPELSANGNSQLWGQTGPAVADGESLRAVSAAVIDEYGNPISGKKVVFTTSEGLIAVSSNAVTNSAGVATVQFLTTTAGTYEVQASVDGQPILNGSPVILTYTSGQLATNVSSYIVSSGDQIANGMAANEVTITLRDANSNLVKLDSTQLKNVSINAGPEVEVHGLQATKTVGVYQAELTSTKAGAYKVTVNYDGQEINASGNTVANFIAGPVTPEAPGSMVLSGQEEAALANGVDTRWVKATLTDSYGNPVSGQAVQFETDSTDLAGPTLITTDDNGVAQAKYTTTTGGTYKVWALVDGVEIKEGSPVTLTFIPDAPLTQKMKVDVTGTKQVGQTVTAKISGTESGSTYSYQWMIDGKNIDGATGQTWKLPVAAGGHKISVTITVTSPGYYESSQVTSGSYGPISPVVTRLSGNTRYATSQAVASKYGTVGGPLFVATGSAYPDALSAGAAAAKSNGTLVITTSNDLSQSVRNVIAQKKPSKIYVIGGTQAVSSKVETQLRQASGVNVSRIGGSTRYETSEMILKQFFPQTDIAYVATGVNFPDALTASRAAAHVGAPVVLVNGKSEKTLPAKIQTDFKKAGVSEVRITGGAAAVNNTLANNISKTWSTTRIAGADRYETAIKVNQVFDSNKVDTVWMATGTDYPDALSAAGAGGISVNQPLYLTRPNCVPTSVQKTINTYAYGERVIVGGTAAINNNVANLTATCK